MDVKILLGAHVFISFAYPGSLIFLCLSDIVTIPRKARGRKQQGGGVGAGDFGKPLDLERHICSCFPICSLGKKVSAGSRRRGWGSRKAEPEPVAGTPGMQKPWGDLGGQCP